MANVNEMLVKFILQNGKQNTAAILSWMMSGMRREKLWAAILVSEAVLPILSMICRYAEKS